MNSKERVAAALALGVADRVPYGEFAVDYDTVERVVGHPTYLRNKAASTVAAWEGRWDEMAQSTVADAVSIAEALPLDVICAGVLPSRDADAPRRIDDSTYEYADGRVLKYSPVTNDFTVVHYPARDYLPTDADVEKVAEGHFPEEYRLEMIRTLVNRFGGERYIALGGYDEVAMPLFGGMTNGLMYYWTDPGRISAFCEAAVLGSARTDARWAALGGDSVLWGADFAYNDGPFLSPAQFRDIVLPFAMAQVDSLHVHGLKVLKHACGNNWALMDAFAEIGYDCYQSIQNSAGMDIRRLKERYGDEMAFWGGVPVEALVSGTPADASREAEKALRDGKPDGGFIFGTSHSVAVGTRYDNYMAMLETFERMRDY